MNFNNTINTYRKVNTMFYPNPKNKYEEKINNIQYKFLLILGISTIIFGIVMYPFVML